MWAIQSIRPVNLSIIAATMMVVKYGFLSSIGIQGFLTHFLFFCLLMATLFIAAGGYVINDIYDVKTDVINNKSKGEQTNKTNKIPFYLLITHIGIGLGAFVSFTINAPFYTFIFIVIAGCLYGYARVIKKWFFLNNLLIAALTAFTIFLIVFFDLYPITFSSLNLIEGAVVKAIGYVAIVAFYLNFIREVVKDIEDIQGDYADDRKTFAIILGRQRASMLVFLMTAIGFVVSIVVSFTLFMPYLFLFGYTLLFISIPLVWVCKIAWDATQTLHYKKISNLLKLTMVAGLGIFLLLPYTLFG